MLVDSNGKRRRRRTHDAAFKSQVIAACRQPGVSISAIALEYRLNANLVRRWLRREEHSESDDHSRIPEVDVTPSPAPTTLVPVLVKPVEATVSTGEIRIVIQRPQRTVKITCPVAQSGHCVELLRELLR